MKPLFLQALQSTGPSYTDQARTLVRSRKDRSIFARTVAAQADNIGQLTAANVSGGSFTISNHGVSGSLLAAPIILHSGQAAILGIGKLEKRVVVREIDGEDAMVILPLVDGSIFTIYFNKVRRKAAQFSARKLLESNVPVFGAVLNGLNLAVSGYYYAQYYDKSYKDYYVVMSDKDEAPAR